MQKQQRVVVYLGDEEHRRLKSILALSGKTVSGWFRELVNKLIKSPPPPLPRR